MNICGKNICYHFDVATTLEEDQSIRSSHWERGKWKLSQLPSSSRLEEVVTLDTL